MQEKQAKEEKPTWRQLLAGAQPLLLPCAHDALSARLIERAGFCAYSVGGYALVGARHALPDIGLVAFGEMSAGIRDIMAATRLPVLIDCDDGYGDVKNVTRTVAAYEAIGVSAIFMEDQRAPKRCGHMAGKSVIAADAMAAKLRAAVAARRSTDLFIIARTDARAVHGLDEALRRAEIYLKAGADGLFIEAPQSIEELARVGRTFQGVPQLANMIAGGGRTPVLPPDELSRLGFAMIAYPTSLIFCVARALEKALADLKNGRLATPDEAVDFETFRPELNAALSYSNGSQGGRPPFDPVMMFKILVIQAANNLSDERTEFLINDRLSFMRFLGLSLADRVPDARTIWLFREKLTKAGAIKTLFERFDAMFFLKIGRPP